MAGPQAVWGIEVGNCALKAIKLRQGADKSVEVVAADYIEHSKVMSQPDADRDALWSAALEKFLGRNDISNDRVVVSISGQDTLARFSKLPPVESKKIPDIVRYEADQQIPFDLDEVVWDYQIFRDPDGPDVEVSIFAIKNDLIRDHLSHFETAGIEPKAVQSSPLALYNAMKLEGALKDGAVVVLDIGTENTDLLVADENSFWSRSIRIGGNKFTEALVKSFKLNFSKAETLKRTAASSKYARQIFQAMRPVFADLVQELQRSIGFYSATHRDTELSKVIGVGSAFELPGLSKYLEQNLQLDVERWDKLKTISLPSSGEAKDHASSYMVPVGLALQGLGQASITCNLLPPEIVKQIIWRKKFPFFIASAACLLLAAGVVWGRYQSDKGTLEGGGSISSATMPVEEAIRTIENPPTGLPPRQYATTILAAARSIENEDRNLESQGTDELRKAETIAELLEHRSMWLKIVSAIHRALPQANDELGQAKDLEAYVELITSEGVARSQRQEILIDSMESTYLADVDQEEIVDEWSGALQEVIKKQGGPRPGFVIRLVCRAPGQQRGEFVANEFLPQLRETGRQQDKGFYINRVGMKLLAAGESDSGSRGSSGNRGGGFGGRDGGFGGRGSRGRGDQGGTGSTPPSRDENVDPVTGETLTAPDERYVITLDVVLQDLPETPDENNGGFAN